MTDQQKIQTLRDALQDFVDFYNDPNMPMGELVSRANDALSKTE